MSEENSGAPKEQQAVVATAVEPSPMEISKVSTSDENASTPPSAVDTALEQETSNETVHTGAGEDREQEHEHQQHHDEDAYELHNDDEYDPANPSHEHEHEQQSEETYDPAQRDTLHALDEYDPGNPGEGFTNGASESASSADKRKASSSSVPSSPSVSSVVSRSPKRQRMWDSNVPFKQDQRGLHFSSWDRLMDFELSDRDQFRIPQVSRASFAYIAALPEFAQVAIVARFSRTPMKDIRDKNALIMRLYREYLAENPLVEKLQPVSVFVDDAASDPGLFAFGYAPPMPKTGVSTVHIPFRRDLPGIITTTSVQPVQVPPAKSTKPASKNAPVPVDEFGRAAKKVKTKASESASTPATAASSENQQPSTPATATVSAPTITSLAAASPAVAAGKPSDPRRRRNDAPPSAATTTTTTESREQRPLVEKSDVYNRLPSRVRSQLDALILANRLPQAINDNVLSRLKHLPEATALLAVEKFAEADLGSVSNLNGFLVGIINRVQERGPPAVSDPRSDTSTATPMGSYRPQAHHQQPQQHHHQQPHQQNHHPQHQQQQYQPQQPYAAHVPMAHPQQVGPEGPVYSREVATPSSAPAWHQQQQPYQQLQGAIGAPPAASGGRFSTHPSIDRAVAALPVSVQNHLVSLVNSQNLPSLDDLSEKCYETLAQLSEGLANDVLARFGAANLHTVRNRSGFLMGVVKNCRQEYGFD